MLFSYHGRMAVRYKCVLLLLLLLLSQSHILTVLSMQSVFFGHAAHCLIDDQKPWLSLVCLLPRISLLCSVSVSSNLASLS